MAYFSLHAYDTDVWLREFRGLNQSDEMMNPDIRFAAEAENVETIHGILQPQAAYDVMTGPTNDPEDCPRVETIAYIARRWYEGAGSNVWYVCAAGGNLYQKQAGRPDEAGWARIALPTGVDAFQSSRWSWVTYEQEIDTDSDDELDTTVDVLLMSNELDGMIMIVPPDKLVTWGTVETVYETWNGVAAAGADGTWDEVLSEAWISEVVDNSVDPDDPEKPRQNFAVIERFGERIFGAGETDEPDRLAYSRPYDPTNWRPANTDEQPEEGAGDVYQPSFDGDKFFALRRFGDQLLAFKKDKIWRVMGYNPGEYTFHEQYGRGTPYRDTIAVDGERVFMTDRDGVCVYDGMNTTSYMKDSVEKIWRTVNRDAMDQMCAVMFERRYYLAFPTGDSAVNNAMLVYDMEEGSILFYPDMKIEAFLPANDELFATSSSLPGKILRIHHNAWVTGRASGSATKWVSPWMDFGYKSIQKGGFDFYFLPEVKDTAVEFTITMQTEKKRKTKTYTCNPLTAEQLAVPKEHKVKRLHFGGSGRKFRLILETAEGVTAPWRIVGGLHLIVETDPD